MDVPLEILDREVARAAARVRAARAAIARGEPIGDNPLERDRRVSSKATFAEIDAGDPLRDGLRAWIYALTLDRVLWDDEARLEAAWRAPTIQIDHADLGRLEESPRALIHRLLAEPSPQRRRLFADALARGAVIASDAARILADRRAEAARRLPADPDAFEIPCKPAAITTLAEAILRRTEPLLDRGARFFDEVLGASVGRDASSGWPARLTPRWIEELFRPTGLTEGLRIDLPRLPAALGATSFARALASFGGALVDADGPRSAPFVLAHPPFDLRRARRAALFGALPADPIFCQRALDLGRGRALDQARSTARALLVSLRLDAARVLLRGVAGLPDGVRAARFEEITAAALGAPIPPSLLGVVPRLSPGAPSILAGAILAASDRRDLIERFDEDWFRSPHAARAIREEDGVLPPSPRASEEALDAGLDELCRVLSA